MALLFIDGFGHYDSDIAGVKYDSAFFVYTSSTVGVDGGPGVYLQYASYFRKNLASNLTTVIVGFRWKSTLLTNSYDMFRFLYDGSTQIGVRCMENGSIAIFRGSTEIASSAANLVHAGVWDYIQIKVTFSTTVGTVEVVRGTESVIDETGLNTCDTATELCDAVMFYGAASHNYMDDFYICDTTGTTNNDFLGAIRVKTLYPTSDGNSTDFVPSSGTDHYALVDTPQLDTLTEYNSSDTVGDKDTYGVTTFAETGTILGVQVVCMARNGDYGVTYSRTLCRSGTTPADNEGSSVLISPSLIALSTIHEQEPTDSVDWTTARLNASEFGIKVHS